VAVDPHDLELGAGATGERAATVEGVGRVGRDTLVIVRDGDGTRLEVRGSSPEPPVAAGDRVGVRWSREVRLESAD